MLDMESGGGMKKDGLSLEEIIPKKNILGVSHPPTPPPIINDRSLKAVMRSQSYS